MFSSANHLLKLTQERAAQLKQELDAFNKGTMHDILAGLRARQLANMGSAAMEVDLKISEYMRAFQAKNFAAMEKAYAEIQNASARAVGSASV